MCIICIDLNKQTLSPFEARRNLSEMSAVIDLEHIKVVQEKISDLIQEKIEQYCEEDFEICYTCGSLSCDCDWKYS